MASLITRSILCLALASFSYASPVVTLAPRAVVLEDASQLKSAYDYVVIGGGTSGLVVANRLTEDSAVNVLVIERGPIDAQDGGTSVPGLPVPAKYSKNLESIPQPGLDGRTAPVYTAAVVGGGTIVNGMFFNRGSAEDYDAWEELGNPGWNWKSLLPYFIKSETFTPPSEEIAEDYSDIIIPDPAVHGKKGPVGSSFSNYQYPVIQNFFRGWNAIGLKTQPEPNGGDANGAFYSTVSLKAKNQSRDDAADAYYRPIAGKRDNFHLITGQTVTKINLNKQKKAVSVDFKKSKAAKKVVCAHATREVIVAAGAPHSPQILQLSGIGPKKLLSGLGIKSLVNLPGVGMNFQDQPAMFIQFTYGSGYPFPTPDWMQSNETWTDEQLDMYYRNRTGPMTIPYFSGSIVSYLPLKNATDDYQQVLDSAASVDLKSILPKPVNPAVLKGYQAQHDLLLSQYESVHSTVMETAWAGGNTVSIAMLKPLSRGSITINTTDPFASPVVDYGTFSHPVDLDVAVASLKKTREWMASAPMQEIGAVETFPGANITSNADIADAIRGFATGTWAHPTSSLSMMSKNLGGVVDTNLSVYGVKGLRVVDASIMPMIIGSHTASTVYAVAEKAADIIKAAQK